MNQSYSSRLIQYQAEDQWFSVMVHENNWIAIERFDYALGKWAPTGFGFRFSAKLAPLPGFMRLVWDAITEVINDIGNPAYDGKAFSYVMPHNL